MVVQLLLFHEGYCFIESSNDNSFLFVCNSYPSSQQKLNKIKAGHIHSYVISSMIVHETFGRGGGSLIRFDGISTVEVASGERVSSSSLSNNCLYVSSCVMVSLGCGKGITLGSSSVISSISLLRRFNTFDI